MPGFPSFLSSKILYTIFQYMIGPHFAYLSIYFSFIGRGKNWALSGGAQSLLLALSTRDPDVLRGNYKVPEIKPRLVAVQGKSHTHCPLFYLFSPAICLFYSHHSSHHIIYFPKYKKAQYQKGLTASVNPTGEHY